MVPYWPKKTRNWFQRLLRMEEINGDGLCPTYLFRWTLLKLPKGIGIYLHKFVGDDWSLDLHDHPKRFISIGLYGCYFEHLPDGTVVPYVAPWIRTFPAEHRHRISISGTPQDTDRLPCWTLVIVLWNQRKWGFWPDGQWVWWRDFVRSDRAAQSKSCPD